MNIEKTNLDKLTENQSLVLNLLNKSNEPMSAYKILHELRAYGLRAPLQIYRALDKLLEYRMVHKLESLNAFVACQHKSCNEEKNKKTLIFIICDICSSVKEMINKDLVSSAKNLAQNDNFLLRETVVELHGKCIDCQK